MTVTNHLLTGAAISVVVRQPVLAVALALVSHFVLDLLPHYGRDTFSRSQKVYIADGIISSFVVVLVMFFMSGVGLWVLGLCLLAAYLPDMIWIRYFFKELKAGAKVAHGRFAQFHHDIQWGERRYLMPVEFCYGFAVTLFLIGNVK